MIIIPIKFELIRLVETKKILISGPMVNIEIPNWRAFNGTFFMSAVLLIWPRVSTNEQKAAECGPPPHGPHLRLYPPEIMHSTLHHACLHFRNKKGWLETVFMVGRGP